MYLAIVIRTTALPAEGIAPPIFAGSDWIMGIFRTVLNVNSDVFCALLVACLEGKINYKRLNASAYARQIQGQGHEASDPCPSDSPAPLTSASFAGRQRTHTFCGVPLKNASTLANSIFARLSMDSSVRNPTCGVRMRFGACTRG